MPTRKLMKRRKSHLVPKRNARRQSNKSRAKTSARTENRPQKQKCPAKRRSQNLKGKSLQMYCFRKYFELKKPKEAVEFQWSRLRVFDKEVCDMFFARVKE